ncbi:MAG: hypothetical protein KDA84_15185, partial [Planctomycetaceae bacterium]|nr:hypothetical protein [Planctomycetaceae bacterium]
MAHWRLFTNKDFQYSRIAQLLDDPASEQDGGDTSPRVLADQQEIRTAVRQVEYRITKDGKRTRFEHGGKTGLASKIPRAHIWRTYRLSLGESLLGVLSIKASEAFNLIELDVFLATEFPQLGSLEIARQMVLFLFADAVRCGTSLAIRTTKYCCGGRIPACIQELAAANGVRLAHADAGAISPEEGKELFLKLSRFPPSVEKRIREIDNRGLLSSARICYLMAKQIWTRQEIECVLTHAPYPELVLGNKTGPNQGLLYSQALFDARCGVLADRLHKVASRREAPTNPQQNRYVENGGEELSV